MAPLALLMFVAACVARWRRREPDFGSEAIVLVSSCVLVAVGGASVLLAWAGWFDATALACVCACGAVIVWPWQTTDRPTKLEPRALVIVAVLVLGSVAFRYPPIHPGLAGRDQGTYVLRAQQLVRTGAFEFIDPILARAGEHEHIRAGPADLLGLYAKTHDAARVDRYEAAYRPGFYLADREHGRVVPQLFHLHPTLLACAALVLGMDHMLDLLLFESAVSVLAMWAIARRLLPSAWPWFATGVYALLPTVIWVHRTPLSETLAGMLGLAGVLALLRTRDRGDSFEWLGVVLLGALAWVRGNAWLMAPGVVIIALLTGPLSRKTLTTYLVVLLGSVIVHVDTVYPYLHDELKRHVPFAPPASPDGIVAIASIACALAWTLHAIDVRYRFTRAVHARMRSFAPSALGVVALVALVAYFGLLMLTGEHDMHSRLDPLVAVVGWPTCLLAVIGIVIWVVRFRPAPVPNTPWLLACAAVPVVTALLYAQRNLPRAGLYYYGRYLVPELIPIICLAAAHACQSLYAWLRNAAWCSARLASAVVSCVLGLASYEAAGVLISDPVTRIEEFEGASTAVATIAESIDEHAVVIAGGEGWHHNHAFNQVGGALAVGHGTTVLPYRSQEAAYASLYELLVAGPHATQRAPPPVYLLLNEATHAITDQHGQTRAAIDDLLPAPFVFESVNLVELVTDRLTPDERSVPTGVTRDVLRFAVARVVADPQRTADVEQYVVTEGGPLGIRGSQVTWERDRLCLATRPIELTVPAGPERPTGLVIVAHAGTATSNHRWNISIDDQPLDTQTGTMPSRERDTSGPFWLQNRPRKLGVVGFADGCESGAIAEVRLLPMPAPNLPHDRWMASTFVPEHDHGHTVTPTRWVPGRALSRFRHGTGPRPDLEGNSMVLVPQRPLRFAPWPLPEHGHTPLELVLTTTHAHVSKPARVLVVIDGHEPLAIDVPARSHRVWQSQPLRWQPTTAIATVELSLVSPGIDAEVHVRDLAAFAMIEPIDSVRSSDIQHSSP